MFIVLGVLPLDRKTSCGSRDIQVRADGPLFGVGHFCISHLSKVRHIIMQGIIPEIGSNVVRHPAQQEFDSKINNSGEWGIGR
jgi:hypothetical protein